MYNIQFNPTLNSGTEKDFVAISMLGIFMLGHYHIPGSTHELACGCK